MKAGHPEQGASLLQGHILTCTPTGQFRDPNYNLQTVCEKLCTRKTKVLPLYMQLLWEELNVLCYCESPQKGELWSEVEVHPHTQS